MPKEEDFAETRIFGQNSRMFSQNSRIFSRNSWIFGNFGWLFCRNWEFRPKLPNNQFLFRATNYSVSVIFLSLVSVSAEMEISLSVTHYSCTPQLKPGKFLNTRLREQGQLLHVSILRFAKSCRDGAKTKRKEVEQERNGFLHACLFAWHSATNMVAWYAHTTPTRRNVGFLLLLPIWWSCDFHVICQLPTDIPDGLAGNFLMMSRQDLIFGRGNQLRDENSGLR